MSNNRCGGVDSYAAFFIDHKVKKLIQSPFFTAYDSEDLKQELMLAYLHAWPSFDKSKGNPKSFIKAVINNRAGMLIREAESQMRWTGQKELSLSTIIGSYESTVEMVDIISGEHSIWGDVFASSSYLAIEQNIDIQKLIEQMPEDIRNTYDLVSIYTIAEAVKVTGISQSTLFSRVKKLRKYLEEHHLKTEL